ncbi:conserved hypothetical protein [Talaromyces stipitatus ATCC 10500]|uniref:Rhodopsin domain-containing protein n=1 Tax=Talaromyces stipitatus (strain ATCC 10500 / CBS 375.48 / QM 6759 / NRRL 1006) TaxID=441959 RepID=B8MQW7_TALSN|nr:uncharacterized protein TSTA_053200 [Talaromyces stipitatus ATCC 10500]EED12802.1 conserved hypothetical protein [Talaromyces stipitatus ATCC 10500]
MSTTNEESSPNLGPELLQTIWIFEAISILIVMLRVVSKARIRKFALDDVLVILALCTSSAGSAILTIGIKHGYGQQVWDINPENVSKVILYDYLSQALGLAGGAISRVSFIVLIISILGTRKAYRIVLWVLVGAQIIINSLFILVIFLQCPGYTSAIWNVTGEGKCWDLRVQTYYGYFQSSFNSVTDFYLAAYSTYISWNLKLKLGIKCGLIGLLSLGIFAMIASIIKTFQIHVLASIDSDPTVATADLERWLYIETYLVIITGSVPCIRSLISTKKSDSGNTDTITRVYSTTTAQSYGLSMRSGIQPSITRSHDGGSISNKLSGSEVHIIEDAACREITDFDNWEQSCRPLSCDRGPNGSSHMLMHDTRCLSTIQTIFQLPLANFDYELALKTASNLRRSRATIEP